MKTKHLVLIILAIISFIGLFIDDKNPTLLGVMCVIAFYLLIVMSIVYIVQHWNDRLG